MLTAAKITLFGFLFAGLCWGAVHYGEKVRDGMLHDRIDPTIAQTVSIVPVAVIIGLGTLVLGLLAYKAFMPKTEQDSE